MNRINERIEQFLKSLNSWMPPEYILTDKWHNAYQQNNDSDRPYLIGIYHGEKVGTERSEGGGGYGRAYYSINQRKIDAAYDITSAIAEPINGETLRDLFFRVVRDGAVTIPIDRHMELVEWLMLHPDYQVSPEVLADCETEY